MKKVFLVLALVAAYGVSMAMSVTEINTVKAEQVTIVADMDEVINDAPEKESKKAKEAKASKAEGKTAAKGEGCATAKSEGCASKKSSCGGEKSEAKKEDSK
jgi:hypothetical protein